VADRTGGQKKVGCGGAAVLGDDDDSDCVTRPRRDNVCFDAVVVIAARVLVCGDCDAGAARYGASGSDCDGLYVEGVVASAQVILATEYCSQAYRSKLSTKGIERCDYKLMLDSL
jgi:hypothetical protein